MKTTSITIMISTALIATPALANELGKLSYADNTVSAKTQKNAPDNISPQIFGHLDVNAITALDSAEMESTLGATIDQHAGGGFGPAISFEGFSFSTFGKEVAKNAIASTAIGDGVHYAVHGEWPTWGGTLLNASIGGILGARGGYSLASGVVTEMPRYREVFNTAVITVTTWPWVNSRESFQPSMENNLPPINMDYLPSSINPMPLVPPSPPSPSFPNNSFWDNDYESPGSRRD